MTTVNMACYVCGKPVDVTGMRELEEDEAVICNDCASGKLLEHVTPQSEAIH